ncbi:MAG: hypothetical protein M3388_11810 [Acidobacteriota bacterium]|nr:hypothetical protein [Acidobacteriota bacterium]
MFKKVAIIFILIFSFVSLAQSQILPAKINSYLNKNYAGWKISPTPNYCGNAKSIVTGDFDGDKKNDYAAKIFKGKKDYIIVFVERKND